MIALLLAAAAALAPAQEAFNRGDYAQAEALALGGEETGAALYLAAVARFRAGNPQGALDLLERAGRLPDPPAAPLWHFNQGSCLYELGRFSESEQQYLLAAADPSLAVAATVNAAFAALDGGNPVRAKDLAKAARTSASDERALDLVADLDAHLAAAERDHALAVYKDGLDAYDAGNYGKARSSFLRAAALDPADGRSRIMAAAAAFRLGEPGTARTELGRALALRLDPADAQTAHAYLDLLSKDRGFQGTARFAMGFDSNPQQTGLLQANEFATSRASRNSALSSADIGISYRSPPRDDRLIFGADYAASQLAYLDTLAADRSLQQHSLTLSLQSALSDRLKAGAVFGGEMDFTGLGNFRVLQGGLKLGGFLSLAETPVTTSRLDVTLSRKQASDEFSYLTGNRVDASLSQDLAMGPVTVAAGYAYRLEDIGSAGSATAPFPDGPSDGRRCFPGTCGDLESFGYDGHTFWSSLRVQPHERITFELLSGFELRSYLGEDAVQGRGAVERKDQLYFGSASLTLRTSKSVALSVRYDVVDNASNAHFLYAASQGGPPDHSYLKQVFSAGTLFWW
ncbi:MAG TPA: tetratricopeptide repeat protein [Myxococcales bacterium]|jgi:Flp pilus assembly protein TadD